MVEVAHQAVGFLVHDGHGTGQLPLPACAVGIACRDEVVDRVEPHAWSLADARIKIAWDRQIQNHQRPACPVRLGSHEKLFRDNRAGRSGCAHDHIGCHELSFKVLKSFGFGAQSRGQFAGSFGSAVHNHYVAGSRIAEVAERFAGHLAGPDEEHSLVVESLEHAACKIRNRHAGNRQPLTADGGFAGHSFRGSKGCLKHFARERPGGLALLSDRPSLLDLRHNLRLAEHHAVEP